MSRNEISSVPVPIEDEKERDHVDHIEHDNEKNTHWNANTKLDDAARILHEAGGQHEFSAEDKRRVLRRIDLFVCVPMCITYFIQQVSATYLSNSDTLARQIIRLLCGRI